MSLSVPTLTAAIEDALETAITELYPASAAALAEYHGVIAGAVATAVVAHIQSAAAVAVSSLTVVTACPAGAGTGTGTGTGTVT